MITATPHIHTGEAGDARGAAVGLEVTSAAMKAVDGVSLAVERGEIVGLIGPNGAGKTTLFNLIAGSLQPSARNDLLDRRADIKREPPHPRMRRGLGRTFRSRAPSPR